MMITMIRCEVPVLGANVLELTGGRVDDLHVAGDIAVTIDFAELIERFVCNFANIEFVVSNGQEIIINIFEDWIAYGSVGGRSVAQAVAVMEVTLI